MTEIETTRRIGRIKEVLEDNGVSPDVSFKLAVQAYEIAHETPTPSFLARVRACQEVLK